MGPQICKNLGSHLEVPAPTFTVCLNYEVFLLFFIIFLNKRNLFEPEIALKISDWMKFFRYQLRFGVVFFLDENNSRTRFELDDTLENPLFDWMKLFRSTLKFDIVFF